MKVSTDPLLKSNDLTFANMDKWPNIVGSIFSSKQQFLKCTSVIDLYFCRTLRRNIVIFSLITLLDNSSTSTLPGSKNLAMYYNWLMPILCANPKDGFKK